MGIETEYGVTQHGNPRANPMLMSSQIVTAYRAISSTARTRARWDYVDEDPLSDARGFRLQRASAHPSLLTDDPSRPAPSGEDTSLHAQSMARPTTETYDDPSAANAILTNGARLYVDHAHPEYSSPEVTTPRDAVTWDVAGERVMLRAARELHTSMGIDLQLYKNNTDGKGASYGTHENYLVNRDVPFSDITHFLTTHLVTRQVYTGSGRVGLGTHGQHSGFQISQRADFMEAEVGLETTLRRPIINTRDEPHADRARWRRLHIIIGDANLLQTATWLKLGTTSIVLWVLEHLEDHDDVRRELEALQLADPVADVQRVSRDLTCSLPLTLGDGSTASAIDIQRRYREIVIRLVHRITPHVDHDTQEILDAWGETLDQLTHDPLQCHRTVEWVAKYTLLDAMRRRGNLTWDHPKLAMMDFQWSDVRPERSLATKLLDAGRLDTITNEEAITNAIAHPPQDTRAYFRGEVMDRYPQVITGASWDSVIFDLPQSPTLHRIPMLDPWRGTRAHVGDLLQENPDPADFLAALLNQPREPHPTSGETP